MPRSRFESLATLSPFTVITGAEMSIVSMVWGRMPWRRMEVSAGIAAYKQAHGLPVLDAAREQAKLQQVAELAPEQLRPDTAELYRTLFALSRGYQQRLQEEQA